MSEHYATRAGARNGSVITVGTFDGVHRGHCDVLAEVLRQARAQQRRSIVVTFEPHPLRVLQPDAAPALLTTAAEKQELLAGIGLDDVVVLPFTGELAQYSAREFVERVLIREYRLRHLVVGYDHGLGRGRSGDAATLSALGEELGFGVSVVPALLLAGEPVSATRIRRALLAGDVTAASAGLGRAYELRGTIETGEGRGRALGFPTANIRPDHADKLVPAAGIYAVRCRLRHASRQGVLHSGPRPTFPGAAPSLEVHVLDIEPGDLYGETVRVQFCARLREVRPFPSAAELAAAIRADIDAARRIFASGGGACQEGTTALP